MTKDSTHTHIHLHSPHHADLLEDFTRAARLPTEDIYVPPRHQPLNPDDEDDVVPEQHAAFGIQRATQRGREPAWRDLGLEDMLDGGPPVKEDVGGGVGASVVGGGVQGAGERVRMMR